MKNKRYSMINNRVSGYIAACKFYFWRKDIRNAAKYYCKVFHKNVMFFVRELAMEKLTDTELYTICDWLKYEEYIRQGYETMNPINYYTLDALLQKEAKVC